MIRTAVTLFADASDSWDSLAKDPKMFFNGAGSRYRDILSKIMRGNHSGARVNDDILDGSIMAEDFLPGSSDPDP